MHPRAVTLADVATTAGVSLATASKALNGRPEVGAGTRARVVDTARELGFTPNQMARSLMSGRTQTVGLLTDDLDGRFVLPVMVGVEDALGEVETMALMANSRGRRDLEEAHLESLLGRRVDAVILVGHDPESRAPLRRPVPVPVVYAYSPSTSPDDTSIVADHRADGRLATQHLLDVGRRRVAHIAGPLDGRTGGHTAAQLRLEGFTDAVRDAGLGVFAPSATHGDWTERWGWGEALRLLEEHDVDGLVCGNDHIARGAIDALSHRGVRVPQDVAVVGFDNAHHIAVHSRLPQTSVDMDLAAIGRAAARAALHLGSTGPGEHPVTGRLIRRAST